MNVLPDQNPEIAKSYPECIGLRLYRAECDFLKALIEDHKSLSDIMYSSRFKEGAEKIILDEVKELKNKELDRLIEMFTLTPPTT